MKKFALATVCVLAIVGFVTADEFFGTITKVDGNKITFLKGNKFKGEDQKEGSADAAPNVKVLNGMFDMETKSFKPGDPIEGGLKNEMFSKIGEKGVNAQITTDDKGKITQILAFKGFGGKGKKKDK
jgi:hypothetical protein